MASLPALRRGSQKIYSTHTPLSRRSKITVRRSLTRVPIPEIIHDEFSVLDAQAHVLMSLPPPMVCYDSDSHLDYESSASCLLTYFRENLKLILASVNAQTTLVSLFEHLYTNLEIDNPDPNIEGQYLHYIDISPHQTLLRLFAEYAMTLSSIFINHLMKPHIIRGVVKYARVYHPSISSAIRDVFHVLVTVQPSARHLIRSSIEQEIMDSNNTGRILSNYVDFYIHFTSSLPRDFLYFLMSRAEFVEYDLAFLRLVSKLVISDMSLPSDVIINMVNHWPITNPRKSACYLGIINTLFSMGVIISIPDAIKSRMISIIFHGVNSPVIDVAFKSVIFLTNDRFLMECDEFVEKHIPELEKELRRALRHFNIAVAGNAKIALDTIVENDYSEEEDKRFQPQSEQQQEEEEPSHLRWESIRSLVPIACC